MDLSYDGERLLITTNHETKEYERIWVEERYNKHYKGTFIEYFVEDAEGKRMLIAQVHPDLVKDLK